MPYYLAIIFIVAFGLVIGSFLNVCIYRLPREGLSIVQPRSLCPRCRQAISWYDNIPLFSFLLLRGRCRVCQTAISWRYPLVELITSFLLVTAAYIIFNRFDGVIETRAIVSFIIYLYLLSALIVATFIDFAFRIIPDEITLSGIGLGLVLSLIFPWWHEPAVITTNLPWLNSGVSSLAGLLGGAGAIYLVGLIGKLIFKKEAMGFGDVKLMAFLGAFLGWPHILFVFFLGCIFGSFFGIISWLITKDRYIAFGPFLALGAVVIMFFRNEVYYFVFTTYPDLMRDILMVQSWPDLISSFRFI